MLKYKLSHAVCQTLSKCWGQKMEIFPNFMPLSVTTETDSSEPSLQTHGHSPSKTLCCGEMTVNSNKQRRETGSDQKGFSETWMTRVAGKSSGWKITWDLQELQVTGPLRPTRPDTQPW